MHAEDGGLSEGNKAATQKRSVPRVLTIPASEPFLPTLARAMLDGTLTGRAAGPADPLDFSAATLLLPTRRAARAVQSAFLSVAGEDRPPSATRAVLLPAIRPISEGDEELSLIDSLTHAGQHTAEALSEAPAVTELERQLVLTRLVMSWSAAMRRENRRVSEIGGVRVAGAETPAQAAALARELARLIDMIETEDASLDGLKDLVREDFSAHWQQTLDFLEIITAWWPAHLAESGQQSAAARRNRLIRAEAARLAASPPSGPVVVAGVTGSIPATVDLMAAVARLEHGALVLPGLDLDLDEASWEAITAAPGTPAGAHPEHPQFGLKTLLDRLGIARSDVTVLARRQAPSHAPAAAARRERMRLVSEALRPSATTARWRETIAATDRATAEAAIDGVTRIDCPSAQDEAETVALILREAAETPGMTAALVSPDRLLARRVAIRLEAWGIRVDDSAGRPLRKTPPGALLDLAISAAAEHYAPRPLMALLKHPLVRLGLEPFEVRRAARALEVAAFRGPYLGRGLDGVRAALEAAERDCTVGGELRSGRRSKAARRLFPDDWRGAYELLDRVERAFRPLTMRFAQADPATLQELAEAHAAVGEALTALPAPDPSPEPATADAAEAGIAPLWRGEAGAAARALFDGLTRRNLPAPDLSARDYPDFYRTLVAAETVRPRVPVHSRLAIWGPFEARLQQPDVLVLGGLNEGTWPDSADPGPWLNRPMRRQLGLPAPEEKLGHAAHDFTVAMGAPRVFLTRAEKMDGVPTVPSRWLMRLDALLGGLGLADRLRRPHSQATYLAWARSRDRIEGRPTPVERPAPRPPVELRPRKLSVSAVETWIANPYAIFAGHILGLEELPVIGTEPGASIRGAIIHEAMARFAEAYPAALPADIENELLAIARVVLSEWTGHPRVAAFWLPRFERFARWFAETEPKRRGEARLMAEVSGQIAIGPPQRPFMLTARADRLDVTQRGVVITDYKTGTPPTKKQVEACVRPQLPLEAAIAMRGGFGSAVPATVTALRYIKASGGDPPGDDTTLDIADVSALANAAIAGLEAHIARFDDPETPYTVTRRGQFRYDYDSFAQLARVAEWSATGSAGAQDGDAEGAGEAS